MGESSPNPEGLQPPEGAGLGRSFSHFIVHYPGDTEREERDQVCVFFRGESKAVRSGTASRQNKQWGERRTSTINTTFSKNYRLRHHYLTLVQVSHMKH